MTAYSSIQASKRIDLLDILRGLALLGVLITNIVMDYSTESAPAGLSEWTTGLVKALTEGSFYPLYSILFGIGFAVWMDKSMKRDGGIWLFAWRSCILFFFGYILIVLIEGNPIFLRYSLLSIPLLLFYKASPKILLAGAIIFLLLGVLHQPISRQLQSMRSPEVQTRKMNQIKKSVQAYQLALSKAKKSKKFSDYAKARTILFSNQLKMIYTLLDKALPVIFSMFLLGMYCWRKCFFTSVDKHLSFWRKIFWLSLIIGLGGQLVIFTSRLMETKGIFIPNQDLLKYSELILNPVLTFFYISLIVLIAYNFQSKPNTVLNGFKAAGRMSLTNFFLQYVIIVILMYPYGLGFNGLLFSYYLLLLAFAIFFLQVLLSIFWFKCFSYGPIEWLWRSLTYMKFQRIKK